MKYEKDIGWWFPDQEEHLPAWIRRATGNRRVEGRLCYQLFKYDEVIKHVPALLKDPGREKVAVDVGAHVGLWTWMMLQHFDLVFCFEPHPIHRDCWMKNIGESKYGNRAKMYSFALGEVTKTAHLRTRTENSSGDTGIEPDPNSCSGKMYEVPVRRLDDILSGPVDLIKMDCEGYELFVSKGAQRLISVHKPTVIVEQKPETGLEERYKIGTKDAVTFLESLGMKVIAHLRGDYIMGW